MLVLVLVASANSVLLVRAGVACAFAFHVALPLPQARRWEKRLSFLSTVFYVQFRERRRRMLRKFVWVLRGGQSGALSRRGPLSP